MIDVKWFGLISSATRIPTIVRPVKKSADGQLFLLHRAWMLWGKRNWIVYFISPLL